MEKYGTIPKKFTKAWWEYVWEYYKFHIAAVLFAIFFVGSIVHTNLTRKYYDLYISYIGLGDFNEAIQAEFDNIIIPVAEDTNEDEEVDSTYYVYNVENPADDELFTEYEYASESKIIVELQVGESFLYILSKANGENMYEVSNCFEPISEFVKEHGDADVLISNEGYPFAVSLAGNEQLMAKGIDTSDMYIAVKKVYQNEKDDQRKLKVHKNSLNAAKQLLGE